jgi:hypothetical protein
MKFCINCKHFILEDGVKNPELGKCAQNRSISPVTGFLTSEGTLPFCKVQRLFHEPCGEDGKLWEEKEASHV